MIHILAAGTSRTDAKGVGEADSIYDNLILDQWTIPFGSWIDQMVDWTDMNLGGLLDAIKWPFEMLIKYFVNEFLVQLPWMWVVLAVVIIGSLVRSPKVGITAGIGLTICGLLGMAYWIETCRTIGMVLVSVFLCALVGIPAYGGWSDRSSTPCRPSTPSSTCSRSSSSSASARCRPPW